MKEFGSITELKQFSVGLDEAEFREVEVEGKEAQDYRAIWNINRNKLVTITKSRNALFQHGDIVEAAVTCLNNLGLPLKGEFSNIGNRVEIKLIFDKEISDGTFGGLVIENDYNINRGATIAQYGWRQVCSNGMMNLGVVRRVKITSSQGLEEVLFQEIKIIMQNNEALRQSISDAMADSLEWGYARKVLEFLIKTKKHRTELYKLLEEFKNKSVTRWDVYNAITNLATHGQMITPAVERKLQRKASMLLVDYGGLKKEMVEVQQPGGT